MTDTIVALSSGAPPSGVAVIRISGPATRGLLERLAGGVPEPRVLTLRTIGGLDRGLVAWFPKPHSFTGEDTAEFHLHGSPAVVRGVLRRLTGEPYVRLAEAGEFTRRAFESGKLDLIEVEGLGELVAAETENQRRQALVRMAGGVSRKIDSWRDQLVELRAEIEARLDFADESDVGPLPVSFSDGVTAVGVELADAIENVQRGRIIRDGLRVALAGPPNVGKSSLLNALVKSDVAIVTDEPGTTRDVREVAIDLDGQLVVLLDMAGLRETDSKAEAEGVRRARSAIAQADLVLWLVAPDVTGHLPAEEAASAPAVWRIATKTDVDAPSGEVDLAVSAVDGSGVAELVARLSAFAAATSGGGEPALLTSERDVEALAEAAGALVESLNQIAEPELAAESLRRATNALERLLGRIDAEAVLDRLFAGFCIGK